MNIDNDIKPVQLNLISIWKYPEICIIFNGTRSLTGRVLKIKIIHFFFQFLMAFEFLEYHIHPKIRSNLPGTINKSHIFSYCPQQKSLLKCFFRVLAPRPSNRENMVK